MLKYKKFSKSRFFHILSSESNFLKYKKFLQGFRFLKYKKLFQVFRILKYKNSFLEENIRSFSRVSVSWSIRNCLRVNWKVPFPRRFSLFVGEGGRRGGGGGFLSFFYFGLGYPKWARWLLKPLLLESLWVLLQVTLVIPSDMYAKMY